MTAEFPDLGLSADLLKGKQSIRATLKLPVEIIKLLSIAAAQLGIKQKTLFDQLVEDRDVLSQVAREVKNNERTAKERRQKTLVLSRNSLISIEKVAHEYELPRDVLVEVSIRRLLPVIDAEQQKQKRRKAVLAELEQHHQQGLLLLQKTMKLVGKNDRVFTRMKQVLEQEEKMLQEIQEIVLRGQRVETF